MMLIEIMKIISNNFELLDTNEKKIFLICDVSYTNVSFFNQNIIGNIFLEEKSIEYCSDIYCKAKRILNILSRTVYLYKLKKAIIYDVNKDLYFNDLDIYKSKHKITIYQNKTLYSFRTANLILMWVDKLENNNELFPEPLDLKNPYTNIKFSKSNLYNIYFSLLFNGFNIPLTIKFFYLNEFNIIGFSSRYYTFLKDLAIENFMKNGSSYEKYEQLQNMFYEFKSKINFIVLNDEVRISDRLDLIFIFKNILNYYLIGKFSCNPIKKKYYYEKSKESLVNYIRVHPEFKSRFNLRRDYSLSSNLDEPLSPRNNADTTNTLNLSRIRANIELNRLRNYIPPPPPQRSPRHQPPPPPPQQPPPPRHPPPPPPTSEAITSISETLDRINLLRRRLETNTIVNNITTNNSNLYNPFLPIHEIPRSPIQRNL